MGSIKITIDICVRQQRLTTKTFEFMNLKLQLTLFVVVSHPPQDP